MIVRSLFLSIILTVFSIAEVSPAEEGEKIYFSMGCYGCHGVYGEGVNNFPKLAGKSRIYLAKRLMELKKGMGHTPQKEMMIPYAKALSEKEIESLSIFLASSSSKDSESLEVPEDVLGGSNL